MAGIKFEFSCGPSAELSLMPSGQRCAMFFSQVTSSEAILCEPIGPKTSYSKPIFKLMNMFEQRIQSKIKPKVFEQAKQLSL